MADNIHILYPADRKPVAEPVRGDKAALHEALKAAIRALVPNRGVAMTYDAIVLALRRRKADGFYVFWPEEIFAAIDEVKAERPPESQLAVAAAVAEKPVEGVVGGEEKPR